MKRVSCVGQEDLCSPPLKKSRVEPERKGNLFLIKSSCPCPSRGLTKYYLL